MLKFLLTIAYIVAILALIYAIIYFGKNIFEEIKMNRELNKIMKEINTKRKEN